MNANLSEFQGLRIPFGQEEIPVAEVQKDALDQEKLLSAKAEALRAVQEWAAEAEPIGAIKILLKHHAASEWLKAELGNLTYEKIAEMAGAKDGEYWDVQHPRDRARTEIAGVLKKYIDKIVTPIVLIEGVGKSLRPDQADAFAEGLRVMMDGNSQDDVFSIIEAARRYSPNLVVDSRLEFFAGKDQPDELHRTEKATGPLLAAFVRLRLGDNGIISISDDDNNPGGLGRTTEVYASIDE